MKIVRKLEKNPDIENDIHILSKLFLVIQIMFFYFSLTLFTDQVK